MLKSNARSLSMIFVAGMFLSACAPSGYRGGANGSTAYSPATGSQPSASGSTAAPSPVGPAVVNAGSPSTQANATTPPATFTSATTTPLGPNAPRLGTAATFAVLAGQTVTNAGPSNLHGDLGVSPGNTTPGFPPGSFSGTRNVGDAVALQAQADLTAAYLVLEAEPTTASLTGQDLGGLTLTKGVYTFTSSAQLTGTVYLDAQGDPNAVFVFQIASTLTTASNASVVMINGAHDCQVFWQVGSSATIGTGTQFGGTILALTSISVKSGASVSGRVLARNGSVTLESNDVNGLNCSGASSCP